jgi:hypothetical protein
MKTCLAFFVFAIAISASAQVTGDPGHIGVYITPYYNSTGPAIEVGPFSKGLAAKNEPEFVATISKMKQAWNDLNFPEIYVAAIRLYDVGFRKESIYWFYSAQYRGRLFATLVDRERMGTMGTPAFELVQAANAFQQLVGPYINGYAFGDIDALTQIIARVQNENRSVPDVTKIYHGIAFKPKSEWEAANAGLNDGLTAFLATLKEQKVSLHKTRTDNGTEAKFSKLTSKELPGNAAKP